MGTRDAPGRARSEVRGKIVDVSDGGARLAIDGPWAGEGDGASLTIRITDGCLAGLEEELVGVAASGTHVSARWLDPSEATMERLHAYAVGREELVAVASR